ncbi:RND family efflux transporter MFP subunit [Novosphingobium sp. Rr 2-17]|uniref:efflux RND transporter periplasmic adaptor subunit n=1 Tax=Novosphingobium sp. Rr 2-17 TaxID=555793 RepID=UPI0002699BF0|nr:efflux RND transporter periplasmic adaptor subunit [Novosphingobium sp. Rr 2-17]EIZ77967.1 RND family efflux transporter MFP subunit [Novosphingobium sp. Rr 2-17]
MRLPFRTSPTLLLPLAATLSACSGAPADPRTGPALVQATSLTDRSEAARTFSGIVSARVQSDIGFRVPGKIIERLVDTGQVVRRGQPLMRLDRTDYAYGASAAENAVQAARARARQTAADAQRYGDLVTAGAVSASRFDQARADADAARAQLAGALAQAGVARNEASYSVIVADADGVVVETLAEPGQVVAAGQTVVRLAHSGPREATINLPETIRPTVGSAANATLYDGDGTKGTARLRQLSDSADPQTRTFNARYVLEGVAANAPLGSTVSISLPDTSVAAQGSKVPLSAIFDNGKGAGVWKIVPSGKTMKVHWSPVVITALGDEFATISQGVTPAERFVALGAHMLHEGQTVVLSNSKLAAAR